MLTEGYIQDFNEVEWAGNLFTLKCFNVGSSKNMIKVTWPNPQQTTHLDARQIQQVMIYGRKKDRKLGTLEVRNSSASGEFITF